MFFAGAVVAGVATAATAATWDMPTPYPEGNFHTKNILQFAQDIDKATNGALKIKVHSNGSLFKHPEIKNAVRSGQVPIGEILLSNLGNESPIFAVDSLPFLAANYDSAKKLWNASRAATDKLFDQQGMMVLYSVPWPPQGIYTRKELKTIDDMKGIKFRTYNPATSQLAKLAGAVPTQVEAADIPQAFSTGRVDAMITSASTGANSKAWDFVSHYHDTQAWLPKNVILVNKKAFRALDKKTQDAILKAAKAAEERGWKASVEENAVMTKTLADKGLKVVTPSPELKAGLQKVGEQMSKEWAEKAGKDGEAILKAYRGK
jgi:TRAP-type C4-dicarboxylate transport system substrate-binding protein